MATPKEQHDARPGARNVGEGGVRTSPPDATPHHGAPPPPDAGDVIPTRDAGRGDRAPEPPDAPTPT